MYPVLTVAVTFLLVAFMTWEDNPFGAATIVYEPSEINPSIRTDTDQVVLSQEELVTPFHALELERAKESSEDILDQFGEYQDYIESNRLGFEIAEHKESYESLVIRMNEADDLFAEQRYDEALDIYAESVGELRIYIDSLDWIYEHSVSAGGSALLERDQEQAETHFKAALRIKPDDETVKEQLAKTALLPELNRLIRESDRAVLRGDYPLAREYLIEAQQIDLKTPSIDSRLQVIDQKIGDDTYSVQLGQAYVLLNSGDVAKAGDAFRTLLQRNPNDAAAQTGLAEVERIQVTNQLKELREQISEEVNAKNYLNAIALYDQVLEINPDLEFAREGKQLQEQLMTSHAGLDLILDDPHRLSLNREYESALVLVDNAREIAVQDTDLKEKLTAVEEVLRNAIQELPLVLISDNLMEVRMTNLGNLEPFDRMELNVRPGRYIVQGSRFGCRDVRKTVIVQPGMDPVKIICENPI